MEVASRGNTPDELEWKKDLYLANGAREVWIVYDKTRSVMAHAGPEAIRYRASMASPVLGATLDIAEFFGDSLEK